jgi:hypothetical protein
MTVTADNLAQNIPEGIVIDFLTDTYAIVVAEPEYVAPSGYPGRRRQRKDMPKLPPPVQPGEVVIDEAVLRQIEEERLAALVIQKKAEASAIVDDLRARTLVPERGTRMMRIDPRRFDRIEASEPVRRRVLTTLSSIGPRDLPKPRITYADLIAIRRSASRVKTGL